MKALVATGLKKTYRARFGRSVINALDGLDLSLEQGEVFGLLGPNGAGKTTTLKILLGLTHATAGHAEIFGIPVADPRSRRRVGYLPEGHRFPGYLTARQTLAIFARMSGLDRAVIRKRSAELLERVRIAEWADVRVKKFSKGMTQRLGLASALIHDPDLLLLDEPTDGVDPVGRREIRDLLREEAQRGKTILVNSHLLSEAELMCDRVAVLRKGVAVAHGRIDDLTRRESAFRLVTEPLDEKMLAVLAEANPGVTRQNGHFILPARTIEELNRALDRVRGAGGFIGEVSPVRSTLEDVFVDLVRPPADDSKEIAK